MILQFGKLCIIKLTIVGEIKHFGFPTFHAQCFMGFIDANYVIGLVVHYWANTNWGK